MKQSGYKKYVINKIRLIGFHNFQNETIEVRQGGHLFLLGDNGSGKTTILDAIHLVLTAGQNLELNSAARVYGRKTDGRKMQGVIHRYNIDTGTLNPGVGVTYAALELVDEKGDFLTIGIGMTSSSMDETIRRWGIIKSIPLAEIPWLFSDDSGQQRPHTQLELKKKLAGEGFYSIGVYLKEIAQRIYGGVDLFNDICRFLSMGKAYREIVAGCSDYHELFVELLPEPRTDMFERIISTLRSLDQSRGFLDDLVAKYEYLQEVHQLIKQIDIHEDETKRYQWLKWFNKIELATKECQSLIHSQQMLKNDLAGAVQQMEQVQRQEELKLKRLKDLEASDKQGIVRQEKECANELVHRQQKLNHFNNDLGLVRKNQTQLIDRYQQHQGDLVKYAKKIYAELGGLGKELPFSILPVMEQLEGFFHQLKPGQAKFSFTGEKKQATQMLHELQKKQGQLELQSETLDVQLSEVQAAIKQLEQQHEISPALPFYDQAKLALRNAMIESRAIYEGLEWKAGLPPTQKANIEETISPEILSIFIVPDEAYLAARKLLSHDLAGMRITCRSQGDSDLPSWMKMCFDIQNSDPQSLMCLAGEMVSAKEPTVSQLEGQILVRFRSHEQALVEKNSVLIGAQSREKALESKLKQLKIHHKRINDEVSSMGKSLEANRKSIQRLLGLLHVLDEAFLYIQNVLSSMSETLAQKDSLGKQIDSLETYRQSMLMELAELKNRHQELRSRIDEKGLDQLESKIADLHKWLKKLKRQQGQLSEEKGRQQQKLLDIEKKQQVLEQGLIEYRRNWQHAERNLQSRYPEAEDIEYLVLRTYKGQQFKTLEAIEVANQNSLGRLIEQRVLLREKIRHPILGAAFNFIYDEQENALIDRRGQSILQVLDRQQQTIAEQKEVINEKTDALFRRIIISELLGYFVGLVFRLNEMIGTINRLLRDRHFGDSIYQFNLKPLEKYQRLLEIVKTGHTFNPQTEQDLREFFAENQSSILTTELGDIPEVLDYRNWYQFEMRVLRHDKQHAGVLMNRQVKGIGSGGEQAVPNYLLVLTIAYFLFNGNKVRLHTLLFDEAFYGIDAGRRDQVLGFASNIGLQLFIASPDQDGVKKEIDYSTTLLIVKDAQFDVHIHPYYFENQAAVKQYELFATPPNKPPVKPAFAPELTAE